MDRLSVLHVISGLETGGTEKVLARLLPRLRGLGIDGAVISLTTIGAEGAGIVRNGFDVAALRMNYDASSIKGLFHLVRMIRAGNPHLIQTWMYHADFLGALTALLDRNPPLVWNIRQSSLDSRLVGRRTLWLARACAMLSGRLPRRIICGSEAAKTSHVSFGYTPAKMKVIPNGYDLEDFRPDPGARREVRAELGIPNDGLLVVRVGRFHPQKDYDTFLKAAALTAADNLDVWFILCGDGVEPSNKLLASWVSAGQLKERVKLLGRRSDVPRMLAASDLAVSSSLFGEGFPNVVGEAMATQVPCVVTDVGDSSLLVGETGRIVEPGDADSLAAGILDLLTRPADERQSLGASARARIRERFGLDRMAEAYADLYRDVLAA